MHGAAREQLQAVALSRKFSALRQLNVSLPDKPTLARIKPGYKNQSETNHKLMIADCSFLSHSPNGGGASVIPSRSNLERGT